jgi:hypothetical protein
MTSSLGAAVSAAWPWIGTVALGIGAGLLGWSLRTYVPKKFEEPQTSIVSVALLIVSFPVLIGSLWVMMATSRIHGGHPLGICVGAGIVFLADRYSRQGESLET